MDSERDDFFSEVQNEAKKKTPVALSKLRLRPEITFLGENWI